MKSYPMSSTSMARGGTRGDGIMDSIHHSDCDHHIVPFMIETSGDQSAGTATTTAAAASASAYEYWTHGDGSYDRKDIGDDTKSNRSAMTNKSTRQVFDFMAKFLPIGIFLLLVSLMVHFVSNIEGFEPVRSISRLLCIVLVMTVIPLSIVFIMKTICDRKDNSCWHCIDEYETDYLSPIRYFDPSSATNRSQQQTMYKINHKQDDLEEYYQMKDISLR